MAGNTWLVNATDYGHCDALEQSVIVYNHLTTKQPLSYMISFDTYIL